MKHYEKETQKLLRQLGANGSYVGFRYTIYGIVKTIQNPELIVYVCKGLYVEIAIHFNVSIGSVERDIRTIINTIWKYGDRELLNDIFGKELTSKPKNATFIDALSHYIAETCEDTND
ncbi:MAG: sporulation initiation factor Spo0A C-terminal domain-containing protein [Eubacterium sp.]